MSDQETARRIAATIEKGLADTETTLVVGTAGAGSMLLHTIRPKPIDLMQIARSLIDQAADGWNAVGSADRANAHESAAICEAVLVLIDRIHGMNDDEGDEAP